ncbi:putative transcription regulator Rcd1-like family [Medicago truncatula]|uniref:Putative transcription regulator Rcd1-like family n=1 Tax=Medicago truncatula TaxID=3880 RepID=A0A396ILU5_MEDTR|nr:putative transcription regulator Rcd1-like family [Medicago truncatula]
MTISSTLMNIFLLFKVQEYFTKMFIDFHTLIELCYFFFQEIISIYPTLSPPNLSPSQSTRVCHVLALLQCVASHPDTRISFLNANMPLYLYPFLKTTSKLAHFEKLRVASLGVIGGSMKVFHSSNFCFLM